MKIANIFLVFPLAGILCASSYASNCDDKKLNIVDYISYKSQLRDISREICLIHNGMDDNYYELLIFYNKGVKKLKNITKNISTKIQDISLLPTHNGFDVVVNIGDNYTKTIVVNFNFEKDPRIESFSIYIARSSSGVEDERKITYQRESEDISDFDIENILNEY